MGFLTDIPLTLPNLAQNVVTSLLDRESVPVAENPFLQDQSYLNMQGNLDDLNSRIDRLQKFAIKGDRKDLRKEYLQLLKRRSITMNAMNERARQLVTDETEEDQKTNSLNILKTIERTTNAMNLVRLLEEEELGEQDEEKNRFMEQAGEEIRRLDMELARYSAAGPVFADYLKAQGARAQDTMRQAQAIVQSVGYDVDRMVGESNTKIQSSIRQAFGDASATAVAFVLDSVPANPQLSLNARSRFIAQSATGLKEIESILSADLVKVDEKFDRIFAATDAVAKAQVNLLGIQGDHARTLASIEMDNFLRNRIYDLAFAKDNIQDEIDNFMAGYESARQAILYNETELPGLVTTFDDYLELSTGAYADTLPAITQLSEAEQDELYPYLIEYIQRGKVMGEEITSMMLGVLRAFGIEGVAAEELLAGLDFHAQVSREKYNTDIGYDLTADRFEAGSEQLGNLIYDAAIAMGENDNTATTWGESKVLHLLINAMSGGDPAFKTANGTRIGLSGMPASEYVKFYGSEYDAGNPLISLQVLLAYLRVNFGGNTEALAKYLIDEKEYGTIFVEAR